MRVTRISILGLVLLAHVLVAPAASLLAADPATGTRPDVDALIAQLGDPEYEVRQRAEGELAQLGFSAFDALSAAQHHEDLEIASRAKYLLRLMQVHWTNKDDPPEVVACLEDFRLAPLDDQLARMARLARLPKGKGLPALCRLVRFEESEILSKHAAAAVIGRYSSEHPPSATIAKQLREEMAASRRTAAGWLRTLARFHDAPKAALAEWKTHTQKEQAILARSDPQTDPRIVGALARQQLSWACKLDSDPSAVAQAIRAVLDSRRELAALLAPHVDWMVEHKFWSMLKLDPAEFAERLLRNPWATLYAAAQACQAAGQTELAEATAHRTLALDVANPSTRPIFHYQMAYLLQHEGLFKWADREYRRTIELASQNTPLRNQAYVDLSQMLHDQGDDLHAAKALDELVRLLREKNSPSDKRLLAENLAQRDFLYASHYGAAGDRTKERKYLDAALAADPTNLDVLIACYRLPNPTPEFRRTILRYIQQVVSQTRADVLRMPTQPEPRNQLAWLVANTEGDLDEALRMSRESLEFLPGTPGLLDTLAHCYYAKGDYENAVKHQIEAAEGEPHSGQIAQQLALFRAAYEKKFGKPAPEPDLKKKVPGSGLLRADADGNDGVEPYSIPFPLLR